MTASYSRVRSVSNISGSSVDTVQGIPAATSSGSGCSASDFTTFDPNMQARAIQARDETLPANKGDVIIYGLPRYRGARDCIFINDKGTLPHSWWNNIESYRWVTWHQCVSAGIIRLD